MYLKLLCEHRPHQVYSALISFDFPLDESLELVSKHNVSEAVAHLKYKLGRTKEAIDEFKSVAKQTYQDYN